MAPELEGSPPRRDEPQETPRPDASTSWREDERSGRELLALGLTALGIVYGDIGTSPLYALRECFHGATPVAATSANVLGVLSLIFWALTIVISLKYLSFIMRAHNRGEGGILALLALLRPWSQDPSKDRKVLILLGLFGAALLYGDGVITPAISVLSAIEGLKVAAPALDPYVIPATILILILLFAFQKRGTAGVGAVFGPVMLLWFATISLLGLRGIVREPRVLAALNPVHALRFFVDNGWSGFLVLGAVFLAVTGGEALYADRGHFGSRPIRIGWFAVVMPALLLNYFGQGALLLTNPAEAAQPFYNLAPQWALYPLVVLATCATVIASQAVISGAFSLTRQAVQLGQCPRVHIIQTSPEEIGQIYIPSLNWALMLTTVFLVLGFRTSSNLAGAYGVAISTTMVITTSLAFFFITERWGWRPLVAGLFLAGFAFVDLCFFAANLMKVPDGGWFPLVAAACVFTLMSTWQRGRMLLQEKLVKDMLPLDTFLDSLPNQQITRVPGTAIVMARRTDGTPPMLLHHVRHNRVLHERVVLLSVITEDIPRVPASERLEMKPLKEGFYVLKLHYGFMQIPNVPVGLRLLNEVTGVDIDPDDVTFYLGSETLIPSAKVLGMMLWREKLFAFMSRNAMRATAFYSIPPDRVVELGMQVEI